MYFTNKYFHLSIYKKKNLNWKYLEKINDIENVIDIGGAQGTIELVYNFPKANYYYFEPLKSCNEELILFNKKNNINYQIFNVALSNFTGEATFYVNKLASTSSSLNKPEKNNKWSKEKIDSIVKTTVPVDKLCNFKEKINFDNSIVKIDAEGSEFNILKGMDDEIFEKVKFFVLEINFAIKRRENECTFDEIFMLLRSKNFKLAGVISLNSFVKAHQGDFLFCKKDDNRSFF
jgi:FkbM family methyltransferase